MNVTLSVIIDGDDLPAYGVAHVVSVVAGLAPRHTLVVTLHDGTKTIVRDPSVFIDHIASPRGVVYYRDIRTVEAYDPNPDFDPDGVYAGGI